MAYEELESQILANIGTANAGVGLTPIFILAAPRTGSTSVYKSMIVNFGLPFISNFTNDHFASNPIIGFCIQKSLSFSLEQRSAFGKTAGMNQPSEASAVMAHWYGGGHPSQIESADILDGQTDHMRRTLTAAEALFGKPLLIKNAWNCFRIKSLARLLPHARFVWLQRDVMAAAASDLMARRVTKQSPSLWNSATPTNYEKLLDQPPHVQVVENQFEFNTAIERDLQTFAPERWIHMWLEDFVADQQAEMVRIGHKMSLLLSADDSRIFQSGREGPHPHKDDQKAIEQYVDSAEHRARLRHLRYRGDV